MCFQAAKKKRLKKTNTKLKTYQVDLMKWFFCMSVRTITYDIVTMCSKLTVPAGEIKIVCHHL